MAEALEHNLTAVGGGRGDVPLDLLVTTDDRPLRDELRRQIARLEQQLSELWTSAFPRKGIDWSVGAVGGPRILGAAELERIRDASCRPHPRGPDGDRPPRRRRGARIAASWSG